MRNKNQGRGHQKEKSDKGQNKGRQSSEQEAENKDQFKFRSVKTSDYVFNGKSDKCLTEGQGTMILNDGTILEGAFKNGKLYGLGKKTLKDGTALEGNFVENFLVGQGKKITADKIIYEGAFKDDKLNGSGKITNEKGEVFSGTFENDVLNGKGTHTFTEASKEPFYNYYIEEQFDKLVKSGMFKNGKLNGKGTILNFRLFKVRNYATTNLSKELQKQLTKSDQYQLSILLGKTEGTFADDVLHGEGIIENPEKLIQGTFVKGVLNGQGSIILYDNTKLANYGYYHDHYVTSTMLSSYYKDNVWHKYHEVQKEEKGYFTNEKLDGLGRRVQNSEIWDGQFKNGALHGKGMHCNGQIKLEGNFIEGNLTKGHVEILPKYTNKKLTVSADDGDNFVKLAGLTFNLKPIRVGTKFSGVFDDAIHLCGSGTKIVPGVGIFEGKFYHGRMIGQYCKLEPKGTVDMVEDE